MKNILLFLWKDWSIGKFIYLILFEQPILLGESYGFGFKVNKFLINWVIIWFLVKCINNNKVLIVFVLTGGTWIYHVSKVGSVNDYGHLHFWIRVLDAQICT